MMLMNGAPENKEGRSERELACYAFLESLGVEYKRVDHPRADNMEQCKLIDEALGAMICKNLFLCNRQQTAFYLLMIPADKVFKTKDLSAQIGSARLSFASPEQMEALLDVSPGSASVLALKNDKENRVRLLVDREVAFSEFFGCHPCENTSSLKLLTNDLFKKILPATGHSPEFVTL
ncbi:MAG: prolyl-tRNA synthetase associated domain-containing protein [Clostridia bacterium]|nr:prolyl-tRNA synthetase associated domain-containing protein [Clostridia bacterium]